MAHGGRQLIGLSQRQVVNFSIHDSARTHFTNAPCSCIPPQVPEETVLTDPTGFHLSGGPYMLIYSRAIPEGEQETLQWPEDVVVRPRPLFNTVSAHMQPHFPLTAGRPTPQPAFPEWPCTGHTGHAGHTEYAGHARYTGPAGHAGHARRCEWDRRRIYSFIYLRIRLYYAVGSAHHAFGGHGRV